MDHFALLPAPERAIVFRETSARLRVGSATIVEKDFWGCWAFNESSRALICPLFKRWNLSCSKVAAKAGNKDARPWPGRANGAQLSDA
jgi:hypothetical protein